LNGVRGRRLTASAASLESQGRDAVLDRHSDRARNAATVSHRLAEAAAVALPVAERHGAIGQSHDIMRNPFRVPSDCFLERRIMPVEMRQDLIADQTQTIETCPIAHNVIDAMEQQTV
jgi:hypothetical protein